MKCTSCIYFASKIHWCVKHDKRVIGAMPACSDHNDTYLDGTVRKGGEE